jgi:4'-phosphopantetheinyl transferase
MSTEALRSTCEPESAIAVDEVLVRYRTTELLPESDLREARSMLSDSERMRHDAYRLSQDRRDYAFAHALLRTSLSRYRHSDPRSWTFTAASNGKPQLADPGAGRLRFSLSHTRGCVACVVGRNAEVGIDVESAHPDFDPSDVVSRYFTPEENAYLKRCTDGERRARFADLWTLKEAFTKAIGHGISDAISAFGFNVDGEHIRFMPPPSVDPAAWQFALFSVDGDYRVGVAINRPGATRSAITIESA